MRKRKIIILLGIATTIAVSIPLVSTFVFDKGLKHASNITEQMAFIDTETILKSEKFITDINASFKENYGDNYEQLIIKNSIATNSAEKIDKLFLNESGNKKYENYFGGMYINDAQELVIQIVKDNIPNKSADTYKTYDTMINTDESTVIEYVDNSYNSLESVNNQIINYFSTGKTFDEFEANYIDTNKNKIIVELTNNTEKVQSAFKTTVIDSDLIEFKKGSRFSVNVNAGSSLGGYCSVGFRAKLNNVAGFVTAGHCTSGLGSTVPYGTVTKYKKSGSVDAAFVTSSYSFTNTLEWNTYPSTTLTVNNTMPYLVNGSTIGKVGITTHATTGNVAILSWSGYVDQGDGTSIYYTDLIRAKMVSKPGDSGGIVFTYSNVSPTNQSVIGIVLGGNDANYCVITAFDNIKSEFGIVRY